MIKCKQLFKILAVVLIFSLLLGSFLSCESSPCAIDIMSEFCDSYGANGELFASGIKEGEKGYADSDFFFSMYGEGEDSVSSYAVFLLSDLDTVGECAVLVCYSEYDAMLMASVLGERMELLRSLKGCVDIGFLENSFIKRYGKIAVMCVLSDNKRAEKIFDSII